MNQRQDHRSGLWSVPAHCKAWEKLSDKQHFSAHSLGLINVVLWACSPVSQHLTNPRTTVGQIFGSSMDVFIIVALYHKTVTVNRHTCLRQACLIKVSIHALSLCFRLFFWTRVFRALTSLLVPVALMDGSAVFSTGPSTLSCLLQSSSSSPVSSF